MKKIIFSLICAGMAMTMYADDLHISGQLDNLGSDTLYISAFPIGDGAASERNKQMVIAQHGKFSCLLKVETPGLLIINGVCQNPDGSKVPGIGMLFAMPGEQLVLNGEMAAPTVSGSAFYQQYAKAQQMTEPFNKELMDIEQKCTDMLMAGTDRDSVQAYYLTVRKPVNQRKTEAIITYLKQHPDDVAAFTFINDITPDRTQEAVDAVNENTRKAISHFYQFVVERNKKEMDIAKASNSIQEGKMAPDFTLNDDKGNQLTLSSLRGKYVLLDYWGSWCHWCIKGFPDMKAAYEKHHDKVEFLGIDCNDSEAKWKQALEQHKLPWPQVKNDGNPDVAVMYAVKGFPTKILIDPQGRIDKIIVGEDPELYTYLDNLFK